jgi:hypothetical protein
MDIRHLIFGEYSLTKVAAVYSTQEAADTAADQLVQAVGVDPAQLATAGPGDPVGFRQRRFSHKLEPEVGGIWRTIVRAHVFAGVVGVLVALLILGTLFAVGHPAVTSSPGPSLFVALFFGTIIGLMFGGLISLRPDHMRVIGAARRAIKRGRWVVVAHPLDAAQTRRVIEALRPHSVRVVRSF